MPRNRTPRPTPDCREIFKLAEQYSEASLLLEKNAENDEQKWSAPRLFVDSFAIELYLKCLFVLDKNTAPPGVHDWKSLFDSLAPHTKTLIRETFDRIVQADVVLRHLDVINPEALMVIDFDRSLIAAKDTFEKRRYTYESQPTGEWFYAHLLREAIRSVTMMDIRVAG